jgi:hypothetical protein
MTKSESISVFVNSNFHTVIVATLRKMPDQIVELANLADADVPTLLQV